MESALIFVVVVAVKLVDPATLLPAACIAGFAALPRAARFRWLIILLGATLIAALFATLEWRLSIWEGQQFRFAWAETVVASAIQIWLISLAFGAWRKRRAGQMSTSIETNADNVIRQGRESEANTSLPPILYFKDSRGAFDYMCKYGRHEPVGEGCVRLAIVEPDNMRQTEDGYQFVWVRVADSNRCFPARAVTAAPNVPPLKGGELVQWFAVKAEPKLANVDRLAQDSRSWWQAWIVAVLAPELTVATGALRTEIDYREFAPRGER